MYSLKIYEGVDKFTHRKVVLKHELDIIQIVNLGMQYILVGYIYMFLYAKLVIVGLEGQRFLFLKNTAQSKK